MYNQTGGFFHPNLQVTPPVFQQQTAIQPQAAFQTDAHLNSQHVLGSNPGYPTPSRLPRQFLPDLNFIRSTPPPVIVSPRVEQQILPEWKNTAPPRDPSYLPSQLSTPRPSTDYSASFQLNATFANPNSGYVNGMMQFPSQSTPQPTFSQLPTSFSRPPNFQMQPETRPFSFNQQQPSRSLSFPQPMLSPSNNTSGVFNQCFPTGQSTLQQQSHRNGSYNQQSPIGQSTFQQKQSGPNNDPGSLQSNRKSAFQQQSHTNNRQETFQSQSSNSNNFQYRNKGNNPFGSQTFNSNDKNHMKNRDYSKNNGRPNNRNAFNRFQSIKKEREDQSSSKPFSCDPCDRSFDNETELKRHLSEHQKCDAGNCQFEAHPKIVFLHKKMQHIAGYAEKINKLSSKEEIEKWRAERRKRFPTLENIARRQAEQAEKEARGEVIEIPESTGKMKRKGDQEKSQNFKRRRYNNRGRNQHHSVRFVPKAEEDPASDPDSSDDEPITKLAKFAGVNAVYSIEMDADSNSINEAASKEKSSESESGSGQAKENETSVKEIIVLNSSSANDSGAEKDSAIEAPDDKNILKATAETSVMEIITLNSSSPNDSESEKDSAIEASADKNTIKATTETSVMEIITLNSSSPNDSGSEKDSAIEASADKNILKATTGLPASNLVVYDVSSDDDAPIEVSSKAMPCSESPPTSKGPTEGSVKQSPEKPVNDSQLKNKTHERGPKRNQDGQRRKREPLPPRIKDEPKRCTNSLLKVLYSDEIKTERNKVFQCLRYIVQNDFFENGD